MRAIFKSLAIFSLTLTMPAIAGVSASARSEYWSQRVSLFDELPLSQDDIVFLGNSITDGGEFAELLGNPDVKNRGISGDVISGVRERIGQVVRHSPKKIFLLIGINDISHNIPADSIAKDYEALVKEILLCAPHSRLYVQAVMPVNNDFARYKNLKGKESAVVELNKAIERIARENNITFIDLFNLLADESGKLPREYTNDGLHLTGKGYRVWAEHVRQFVDE